MSEDDKQILSELELLDLDQPVIEHDPGEFRRPILEAIWTIRIQVFVLVGISLAITLYTRMGEHEVVNPWDVVFVFLFLCLLAWCIAPRVPLIDADGHERARNSLAFRLGKALKRVLNNRRRDTAPRD